MKRAERYVLMLLAIGVSSITACKKSEVSEQDLPVSPTTGTRLQFTLDSIYLYANQTYLWNDALPDYNTFSPRNYTNESSDLLNLQRELFAITQYKINPATNKSFENGTTAGIPKYSYIQQSTGATGFTAAVNTEGNGNDFGIEIKSLGNDLYVSLVYPASPAALAGLQRGDQLITINDQPATGGIALAALNGQSINLLVRRGDATQKTVRLNKAAYVSSPVLKAAVINDGGLKLGYLAFSQFNQLNTTQTVLDNAFTNFSNAEITDLVIDLRYNRGGYVETAKYLANLIASSGLNGKTMYAEHFNSQMQQGKATILKNQPYSDSNGEPVYINNRRATYADVDFSVSGNTYNFNKSGNLQTVKNIYFIVSGQTASASELLINVLKPYYTVKLIGEQTYGKPVGFFGVQIDQYTVYLSSFLIKNASGFSDYFEGFPVDIAASDDITRDFGDPEEECLQRTLAYIQTSSTTIASSNNRTNSESISTKSLSIGTKTETNTILNSNAAIINSKTIGNNTKTKSITLQTRQFPGMIENSYKLKKQD